jgi:nicotinate-nucleotide adenylyltransferase
MLSSGILDIYCGRSMVEAGFDRFLASAIGDLPATAIPFNCNDPFLQPASSTNMSYLCFGGSFNPIHHGHLICARAAAEAAGLDKVLLIPSRLPPHKAEGADLASPADRLEMCREAVKDDAQFQVSDIELNRDGPSYTIDTVRELKHKGCGPVNWLIGADMLQILPQWHEPEALMAEAKLYIMARPGWNFDWESLPPIYRGLQSNVVATPLISISATDIRRRQRASLSIDYYVPPSVADYVREHKLYQ